jgi:23S rRNA (guanosine2251-2'-O)-methyltransferase
MHFMYGINCARELLRRNQNFCEKIVVSTGRKERSLEDIIHLARQQNIPVEFWDKKRLDSLAGNDHHQGVICFCRKFSYVDLQDILKSSRGEGDRGLVLMLDGIMDPHNLGSIIRTAYCLGADGVVIPEDRSARITATVGKTSAGSVWQMPVARVVNLSHAIDFFKDNGFWVFGAEARVGQSIHEADFNCPVVLVMGGEAKGIRALVKRKCDFLVHIPMTASFNSLNVSVAAGIILHEIVTQRQASAAAAN